MATLAELVGAVSTTQAAYLALQESGTQAQIREASLAVKVARKAVSDAVTTGAKPCPICGSAPVGLIQPLAKGRFEFEVGCPSCGDVKHILDDGTVAILKPSARGGPLPRHAVEGWNAGPEAWTVRS